MKMVKRAHPPRPRPTGVESGRMFGKNYVENTRAPAKCTNPILESALFLCNIPYCILEKDMVLYWCQGERLSNREATKSASVVMKSGLSKKKCKNPLDKSPRMWYNKDVLKRGTKKLGRDLPREMEIDTMANKMTNKGALQFVLDTYDVPADVAEKLNAMLAQLEKKSGAERKPTARQVENAKIKDKILSQMEPNVLYTVGEMLKKFDTSEDMTSQRLTALLSQMADDGAVAKTKEKGKSLFSLAE